MKIINLGLLMLILFLNCNKGENNEVKQIKNENYLEIYYLKGEKHYPFTITCDMIRGEVFEKERVELKITDQKFMKQFFDIYKKYQPSDKKPVHDTRIQILVHQGEKVDVLCMGKYFSTSINGKRMQDLPELLTLIKDKLNQK